MRVNPNTWETRVPLVGIWGQSGLPSEFQDNQDFLMRPYISPISSF